MKLEDFPRLRDASTADKLALIDALWESIPAEQLQATPAQIESLNRRLSEVQADPSLALTPQDAARVLRERLKPS
ncbi:MAG: addiction module protein [Opitutales bacterium]